MELFLLYLWLKLDFFGLVLCLFFMVGLLIYGFSWIIRTGPCYFDKASQIKIKAKQKLILVGTMGCLVASLVLPSSKDVAILVAGSDTLDLAKSPEGAKVATLLRGIANEVLNAEIKKLNPGK